MFTQLTYTMYQTLLVYTLCPNSGWRSSVECVSYVYEAPAMSDNDYFFWADTECDTDFVIHYYLFNVNDLNYFV